MSKEDTQAQQGHLGKGEEDHQDPVITDADTSGGKIFAGKYNNPEDLEKAYQQMEVTLGRQGQELGQLRQLRDRFERLEQTFNPQASPEQTRQRMVEAFEADPVGFIQQFGQGIIQQTQTATEQKMAAQLAVNAWLTKNPEFTDPRKQQMVDFCIQNYINTNPETAYLSPQDKLEKAGGMVKDFLKSEFDTMQKTQAQRETEIKKMAAMETGQSAKVPNASDKDKPQSTEDYIAQRQKDKQAFLQRGS